MRLVTPSIGFFDASRRAGRGRSFPRRSPTSSRTSSSNCGRSSVTRLRDHGEGNSSPTLEWVAELTCPKDSLVWSGSTGHKVNLVGQIVRYRAFVTFGDDEVTRPLLWWDEMVQPASPPTSLPKGVSLSSSEWLDYVECHSGAGRARLPDRRRPDRRLPDGDPPPTQRIPGRGRRRDRTRRVTATRAATTATEDGDDGEGNPGGDTEGGDTDDGDDADGDDDTEGERRRTRVPAVTATASTR